MSVIDVNHLTFYYDGSPDAVFEDVTFQIDSDWKLGLIGRNGRGKTTFLRLLMGELEYRGTISSAERFAYFPYPVQDQDAGTLEVLESLSPDCQLWKLRREFRLLEVDEGVLYRPFGTLSNGERTKVMLALLFSEENRFLLIDEPTNHLDQEARLLVREYLKKKKGFLLVSHDRAFLDHCIDHVLALNRNSIEVCQGNFSSWWQDKQNRDAFEQAENEKLKKEISRLESAAGRNGRWADRAEASKIGTKGFVDGKFIGSRAYLGEKSRKLQQQRKNLERRQEKVLQEKKGLLQDRETAEDLKIIPLFHHKEVLVRMEDVSLAYPDTEIRSDVREQGCKAVLEHFDLEIRRGQRVFLQGRNGCGKTSVLKAILGAAYEGDPDRSGNGLSVTGCPAGAAPAKIQLTGGRMELASGLVISYVPQDPSFLKGRLADYVKQQRLEESLFKALLRKLDFSREQFEKDMADFSAGQKKKVLLAGSLCQQAHLYLWDEPLNYVDVFSRMQIEDLLLRDQPTMLLVEHDRAFAKRTATQIIAFT